MKENNEMIVTDAEGNEFICEILFTHEHNGKSYVVFEFQDTKEISAAEFIPGEVEDEGIFQDIETDEEWDMLDKVLEAYFDDLDEEEEVEEV
jgi:uncharacterized protein YrzB (UPF0473 family)